MLQKGVRLLFLMAAGIANIIKQAQIAKVDHHALDHAILNGDHPMETAKTEAPQMAGVKYQMDVLATGNSQALALNKIALVQMHQTHQELHLGKQYHLTVRAH